jgi:epoxyqueuosine reductase QueG
MKMGGSEEIEMEITELLKNLGALKVGFASASGSLVKTGNGYCPREVMPECNSVIVLAVRTGLNYYQVANFEGKSIDVDGKTYRVCFLFTEWLTLRISKFLEDRGYKTMALLREVSREKRHKFSFKLAAYEAGIGVFGRCGLIITPECGPRIRLGVLLTDARLKPTGKLQDFDPCKKCQRCAELCPVKAIDPALSPPRGFDREKCVNFVNYLRKKTRNRIFYCGVCFDGCPVGSGGEEGFELQKLGSLQQLKGEVKERLLKEWKF